MSHDAGHFCYCVATHNPRPLELERHHIQPLAMQGPDIVANVVWICPTTHTNVHEILRTFVKAEKILPRVVGQPPYSYKVAVEGFRRWRGEPWVNLDPEHR